MNRCARLLVGACAVLVVVTLLGCPSAMPPAGNGNTNDNINNNGAPSPLPGPDADGDGVPNDMDLCPDTPQDVSVDLDGCPLPGDPVRLDDDGDGVSNGEDNCPNTPQNEPVDAGGCAASQRDSDHDGVNDDQDQCADSPAGITVDANGCPVSAPGAPDDDGDGVGDDVDQCLGTQAGQTVDANGCAANQLDSDNDGVTDDVDQCPNTPRRTQVDASGCAVTPPPPPPPPPTTCGNGVVDAGEQCDDGNTTGGDGCSANCTIEQAPANNDPCTSPTEVTDGTTQFDTTGATTDGPPEPSCNFLFGDAQINQDLWFTYVATCTGEAIASLCGSSFDTKIALYDGAACPTTAPVTCSDDDCGVGGFDSRVTFQAVQGQTYLIRVGAFETDQGVGMLTLRCGQDACGAGSGLCGEANGSPGCEDATCCSTTCAVDPFCCDVDWDATCADESAGLCSGSFASCAAGSGSCAMGNGSPGCDQVDCCNTVCMNDPFCCIASGEWDDICTDEANGQCFLTCGDANAGSCFSANGSPGCDTKTCCETVCGIDDLCCTNVWDNICADLAATNCR